VQGGSKKARRFSPYECQEGGERAEKSYRPFPREKRKEEDEVGEGRIFTKKKTSLLLSWVTRRGMLSWSAPVYAGWKRKKYMWRTEEDSKTNGSCHPLEERETDLKRGSETISEGHRGKNPRSYVLPRGKDSQKKKENFHSRRRKHMAWGGRRSEQEKRGTIPRLRSERAKVEEKFCIPPCREPRKEKNN